MTKALQYVFMGLALIAAFAAGNYVVKLYQAGTPEAKEAAAMVSQHRPSFSLPDMQGVVRHAKEWDGQVLVLNFWATWCPPCRKEMPDFIAMQELYGAQGLQFVGVALDELEKVETFIDTMGVEYPILLGGEKALDVSNRYGNTYGALPYTVLIDREGMIVSTFRGEVSRPEIEKTIKTLL